MCLFAMAALAGDVPRMTKEELKGLLGNPNVIVLDVRVTYVWERSDSKIKGAYRESKEDFNAWADKYPKTKTLVLYCA